MKDKKSMPGFDAAEWALRGAIFRATIDTRVLLALLRETRKLVKAANRTGFTANVDMEVTQILCKDTAVKLQRITREVNAARRAAMAFMEINRETG